MSILDQVGGREQAQIIVDRLRGWRSFKAFAQMAWPIIEPAPLIWSWHLDAFCTVLEAVTRGEIQRLIVDVPPGLSKSLLFSVLWPAWDWIQEPTRRYIPATYGQTLSDKGARLHRDLVQSEWFQARWGDRVMIAPDSVKQVREFKNTAGGWRFSTSVGGAVTGNHGDVLLFDDLAKAQDAEGRHFVDPKAIHKANDFWFKTMATRRADPRTTRYIGIMQRLHYDDTAGVCIAAGYVRLVLPMEYEPQRKCVIYTKDGVAFSPPLPELDENGERVGSEYEPPKGSEILFEDPRTEPGELLCPERFPREIIETDKETLGPRAYRAQMQQDPTKPTGDIFKVAKLQIWKKLPIGRKEIIVCDAAFKDKATSDFVCIQHWIKDGPRFYLTDQILDRLDVGGTCEAIARMKDAHPRATGIYIEDKANGPAIMQIMEGRIPGLVAWDPGASPKVTRAEAVAPLVEAGNVYTPDPDLHGWVQAYRGTLAKFPLVTHDDEVDATTMALLILHTPGTQRYADAIKKWIGR